MNKLILFLVLQTLFLKSSQGQINISTSLRSDYTWNSVTEEWDWVSDDGNEQTFFEINKGMTLMKHTTPTLTSNYIIKSSKEDKVKNQWEFNITSDVGNNYIMILDIKNNNVRFIGKRDGVLFLVKHKIKRIWFDE